jgi:sulfatase maturation enzyme AslB (radical SAM superfamily)
MSPSLLSRRLPLAAPEIQDQMLGRVHLACEFDEAVDRSGLWPLKSRQIEIFQINVGKFCNQTCRHCHVDAGPDRREVMSRETMTLCLAALEKTTIPTVDITGGAPELNPDFRWLVAECRARGRHVIDRCNLTVLELPSQQDLAAFLADQQVEIVCSLPHYRAMNTDRQRGAGVYEKSIAALKRLNTLGFGNGSSGLRLVIVTNPVEARAVAIARDSLRCAVLHREHANQPVSRVADRLWEPRGVHGTARCGVQSSSRSRANVPQHVIGRMGRTAVRL